MRTTAAAAGLLALVAWPAGANVMDLTTENFEAEIRSKSAFIKFHAPWCGHCKRLKPTWDELGALHKNSATVLIGSVDCTAEASQLLCRKFGIRGYPTLKYFTEKTDHFGGRYEDGRSIDELEAFVKKNLGPPCSVTNPSTCSEAQLLTIEGFKGKSMPERHTEREKLAKQIKDADEGIDRVQREISSFQERINSETDGAKSGQLMQQVAELERKKYQLQQEEAALFAVIKPRLKLLEDVIANLPIEKSWGFF